jgi:hypothetical protein
MRFAGFCFIAIAFIFVYQAILLNDYSSIQTYYRAEDNPLNKIKLLGFAQIILLVMAGFGMIFHNAMLEEDAREKFSSIENRIKNIERVYDTDKSEAS